jgi:predicted nucleic-acid-binding protein
MTKFAGSLDANVLLRLMLDDIPEQHNAAVKLLESSRRQFAVADTALIEFVFALEKHYQFKRATIEETVEALLSLPVINANRALMSVALPLYVKQSAMTFEDCCIQVYADLNHALPLWTFDKKLAARAPGTKHISSMSGSLSYEMM